MAHLHTHIMESHGRFAAIRLVKSDTLLVKTPDQPVSLKLNLVDPLTNAQMRLLAQASPWNPLIIIAQLGKWNDELLAINATVTEIESPPRNIPPKHTKKLRWGLIKRKRGFISHD
jgi:hypothetical protein